MIDDTFKLLALQQCSKSTYKERLGAVVVSKGKVVGKGYNKVFSVGQPYSESIHAEIDALNDTKARYRKGSTIYVSRITKDGSLALAKPCSHCVVVMKKLGVKYVCYSDGHDWTKILI